MEKKIVGFLMLILLLTSTLGMASIIKPSLAKENESSPSNEDFIKKTNEKTVNSTPQKSKDPATSRETRDKWNFNETNLWKNFTYTNGDKTRLIVGLEEENSESLREFEKIAAKYQAEIVNTISIREEVKAAVVELSFASVATFVQEVKVMELVSYVEPNMKVQTQWVPNDPYWTNQWGPQKIEADWAWNTTTGSSTVLVAIVDTGIDYTHPDLAANYAPLGFDWVNMDADPKDDFGHGTHCAGIVAAVLNNSIGVAGLAQVRIMSEKVLDSGGYGYWDWVANGIIHATDSGADIISMSLGGYGDSELVHSAVKYAYDSGVLVIAAAGNDNTNMKSYPAGYDEVIAVAATDQYDNKAYFSNWGDWIELAAPGVDIYSTMPTYWVTMNNYGFPMNYAYMSGTSMACPHVSGLAALVRSLHPEKSREWLRLWLRYAADDLGNPGFDVYYGYGRINARKAIEQTPPGHELIAYALQTPPYVKPGTSGTINVTILNFGEYGETDIVTQLLANDTVVDSTMIDFLASGNATTATLSWSPLIEGQYNVTVYILPALGETHIENNMLSKVIYVGIPVKAVVLHSAGNVYDEIITNWQVLSNEWYLFGDKMVYVDYTTLNKEGITYEDIVATEADVLIISCAYDPYAGWQFTDAEIEAITLYIYGGHGLIVTAGTLYYAVPNNNKLAKLIGINENITYDAVGTDLLHLLNTTHPLFKNVPNPFVFAYVGTATPSDGRWDSNELVEGKYLALGHYQESAIVTYKGLVYISPWLEVIPPYYHHHLQLLYNAILWSRYPKPEHELVVSLETPRYLQTGESALLNATVLNKGLSNETNVELYLLINGTIVSSATISEFAVGESYTINYFWTPPINGIYNVTAYAPPLPSEELSFNNIDSTTIYVGPVRFVLWDDTKDADDDSLLGNYLNLFQLLTANGFVVDELKTGPITSTVLADYDILVLPDPEMEFSLFEIAEIQEWVEEGGALVIIPDGGYPMTLNTLMAPYGVQMTGGEGGYGITTNIMPHPITQGVGSIYVDWVREISVTSPSTLLAWTAEFIPFLSTINSGEVVVLSDSNIMDNYGLAMADNTQLMLNMFNWIAIKPEHDLVIRLEAPLFLEPDTSVLLNATVRNRGANNETDVELQILINGTLVDSAIITELLTREFYTLSYLWTPNVEGTYNITAYTLPIPDEGYIENNVASTLVEVKVLPAILIVADDDALYKIRGTSLPEFEYALTSVGYDYFVWQESTMGRPSLDFLAKFKLVIWTCGDCWGWAIDLTDAETLEAYLAMGGNIVLEGEDIGYDHHTDRFMLNVAHAIYQVDSTGAYGLTVTDPTHPVTQGLPTTFTWLQKPPYDDGVTPTNGGFEVIRYTDTPWTAVTVFDSTEAEYGSVIYYAFPIYCVEQSERHTLIINSVNWFTPQEHDLAISLNVSSFLELGGLTLLNATVKNKGINNETNVDFYLLVNGTVICNMVIDELLVSELYSISRSWTPTDIGNYNITAYALPVLGETYIVNNVATQWINVFYYRRSYISHEWIDMGTPMNLHSDDQSWLYTLPFDFPFYGVSFRQIYISSNGLITFLGPDNSNANGLSALAEKFAMAPAWDDWMTWYPYDIYIWESSTDIGIRWYANAFETGVIANFEVILNSDGSIQFNYQYVNGTVTATAGISNGLGHILAEDLTDINFTSSIVFVPTFVVHDVAIIDVEPSASEVTVGGTVDINVIVENQGDRIEDFTVTAYAITLRTSETTACSSTLTSTRIYLDPSDYIFNTKTVSVGYKFNVTVKLEDVEDLMLWQIRMFYNGSIINATRWFEPTWDLEYVFYNKTTLVGEYLGNNSVMVGAMLFPSPPEQVPFYGSGKLCIIEFEITALPPEGEVYSCSLNINNDDTFLWNSDCSDIAASKENGYYELRSHLLPALYVIGVSRVIGLASGEKATLTFTWNTTGATAGDYLIYAVASRVQYETDRQDNAFYNGIITVKSAGIIVHDIAVVDVAIPFNAIYLGWTVSVNVTVANLGNSTETFTVALYCDNIIIAIESVQNLEPNATLTLHFNWDTTNVLYYRNYTIKAVASTVSDEVNTENNIFIDGLVEIRIMGDVNGDGKVDMIDVGIVCFAFGASPGHPRWDPICDLDQNGIINLRDIGLTAKHFGEIR